MSNEITVLTEVKELHDQHEALLSVVSAHLDGYEESFVRLKQTLEQFSAISYDDPLAAKEASIEVLDGLMSVLGMQQKAHETSTANLDNMHKTFRDRQNALRDALKAKREAEKAAKEAGKDKPAFTPSGSPGKKL